MATRELTEADRAALFADLVRIETRLYNDLNDVLRAAHGIVTSQYEFLRHIEEHEGSRITDLSNEFAVGVGAVSKAMDRLETRGLIERRPNPENRRSSLLVITDDGRALLTAADATFAHRLASHLARVGSPDRVASAAAVLHELRTSLERGGVGVPAG